MRRTYEAVIVKLEGDIALLSDERNHVFKRVKSVGKTRAAEEQKRLLEVEAQLQQLQYVPRMRWAKCATFHVMCTARGI